MKNEITGAILEYPPPDSGGWSNITINGNVILTVHHDDGPPGRMTTKDGRVFQARELAEYVAGLIADYGSKPLA